MTALTVRGRLRAASRITSIHVPPLALFVVLLAVAHGALFSWLLLRQHHNYLSNAYDLGFFDQILLNTSRGDWFEQTFVEYHFFGQHFEPVLLVYAGLYRLGLGLEVLFISQSVISSAAALPLFVGTRRLLGSDAAAALVSTGYLLSSHLHEAMLFDFHPEVMGPFAVFTAFALMVYQRPGASALAIGALFLLKEDAALVAIGIALVLWLRHFRRAALLLAGGTVLYLALVPGVVMTALRGGGAGDLQERYQYLGATPAEMLLAPVRRPGVVLGHLVDRPRPEALARLLISQGGLPLASPVLLGSLPSTLANVMADHPPQARLSLHYSIYPLALTTVSAVFGMSVVLDRLGGGSGSPARRKVAVIAPLGPALLFMVAQAGGFLAWSPLGLGIDLSRYRPDPHARNVTAVLATVPADAAVSAQGGMVSHLSRRQAVFEFPDLGNATVVVIDARGWRSSQAAGEYAQRVAALPELGFCRMVAVDGVERWDKVERCP